MFQLDARVPVVFGDAPSTSATDATLQEDAVTGAAVTQGAVTGVTVTQGAVIGAAVPQGAVTDAAVAQGAVIGAAVPQGAVTSLTVLAGAVTGFAVTAGAAATSGGAPRHAAGCACCAARSNAGRALAALLQNRARGQIPFFTRVVAVPRTPAGRAEICDALQNDPVASACFRLAE